MYQAFILLYFALNIYPGYRLYSWLELHFAGVNPVVFAIVFAIFPVTSVLTFYSDRLPVLGKKIVDWVGGLYMCVFLFSFVFWALYDILRAIFKANGHSFPMFEKYGGIGVLALSAVIILIGVLKYMKLHVTHYKVDFNHKIEGGFHAVMISDIHLGAVNSERRLKNIVRVINEQKPDAVFISGDLFNNNFDAIIDPEKDIEILKQIKSKYGIFYSLGNHDAGKTFHKMVDFVEKAGITLLNDEFVVVDDRFAVLGRIDPIPIGGFDADTVRAKIEDVEKDHDYKLPVIVIDHNPMNIGEYDSKYDLILCGHTHHGQMFPANIVTGAMYKVDYGMYRENPESPAVIVSSGAGNWAMPFRTSSICEVVSIDIV